MSDPKEHTLNEYNKLLKLLRSRAEEIGLCLHSAGIIPPFDDTPVLIQVSFVLGEETKLTDEEQEDFDAKFKEFMEGQTDFDLNESRKKMLEDFEKGDGFFKDFDK